MCAEAQWMLPGVRDFAHRQLGTMRRRESFGRRHVGRMATGIYSDDAVKLLLFVRWAQSLSMTLKKTKRLLNLASQASHRAVM